jgi:hypothetical protein
MKLFAAAALAVAMALTLFPSAACAAAGPDFTPSPKTPYAAEFLSLCEGQQWFINEVERLLEKEQKTMDKINSPEDLDFIKSLGFTDRGITGHIPAAFRGASTIWLP